MTNSQKLALRLSELRQKLNALSAKDELTEAEQDEIRSLSGAYPQIEERWRAAQIAEGAEEDAARGEDPDQGDGEAAEVRRLRETVRLSDYLSPAAAGIGLSGGAAEFNAALSLPTVGASGGIAVPWDALLTPELSETRRDPAPERRASTTTTQYAGGVGQRPILQRLFGMDILAALGVRLDSVPAGRTEWPLLTGGVAPAQKAEGTAASDAVAATFATEVLKPKRLTGVYEYTHEQAAQVVELEAALRRDLADAVRAKMSDLALNGNEGTNAHEPDGFLTVLTAPTAPTAAATYADYAGSHAAGVDGIHASAEREVSSVIGVATYRHAAGVFQSGSGESGSEALARRSARCMASSFVPAPPASGDGANIQAGNVYHAAGPNGGGAMRGDSVAAVWPTLEVIRDIYSQASVGVRLTWVALWDLQAAFRSAAYSRLAFKLA